MEYETKYKSSTYKFVDTGSWIVVYVNGEKWVVPQGDRFLRALMEDIQKLKMENERYKDINQGLLEVQISLRTKEKENQQWFEAASYNVQRLQKENDSLCDKLADIRTLFDETDMKAEGHGMEDAVASPYAVAVYAENKLKRLINIVKDQQEELELWRSEGMI